jgi:hypothetical protein
VNEKHVLWADAIAICELKFKQIDDCFEHIVVPNTIGILMIIGTTMNDD